MSERHTEPTPAAVCEITEQTPDEDGSSGSRFSER